MTVYKSRRPKMIFNLSGIVEREVEGLAGESVGRAGRQTDRFKVRFERDRGER